MDKIDLEYIKKILLSGEPQMLYTINENGELVEAKEIVENIIEGYSEQEPIGLLNYYEKKDKTLKQKPKKYKLHHAKQSKRYF